MMIKKIIIIKLHFKNQIKKKIKSKIYKKKHKKYYKLLKMIYQEIRANFINKNKKEIHKNKSKIILNMA